MSVYVPVYFSENPRLRKFALITTISTPMLIKFVKKILKATEVIKALLLWYFSKWANFNKIAFKILLIIVMIKVNANTTKYRPM